MIVRNNIPFVGSCGDKLRLPSSLFESGLSARAIGVYAYIVSLPQNEPITIGKIVRGNPKNGRDAVKSAVKELVDAGFVTTESRCSRDGWVYLIEAVSTTRYKIGKSNDPYHRFEIIQSTSPIHLQLVHTIKTVDMVKTERSLHAQFAKFRCKGEWFELDQDSVNYIKSLESL